MTYCHLISRLSLCSGLFESFFGVLLTALKFEPVANAFWFLSFFGHFYFFFVKISLFTTLHFTRQTKANSQRSSGFCSFESFFGVLPTGFKNFLMPSSLLFFRFNSNFYFKNFEILKKPYFDILFTFQKCAPNSKAKARAELKRNNYNLGSRNLLKLHQKIK